MVKLLIHGTFAVHWDTVMLLKWIPDDQAHYVKFCNGTFGIDFNKQIDGLVQERCNSIANALELYLSYTNPLKWFVNELPC